MKFIKHHLSPGARIKKAKRTPAPTLQRRSGADGAGQRSTSRAFPSAAKASCRVTYSRTPQSTNKSAHPLPKEKKMPSSLLGVKCKFVDAADLRLLPCAHNSKDTRSWPYLWRHRHLFLFFFPESQMDVWERHVKH